MAFTAGQSFSFGEQPSTTKWNYLWGNDYALQDWSAYTDGTFPVALMDANAIGFGLQEIGRTTLGAAGDTITVSSLPSRRYLLVWVHTIPTGGAIVNRVRFNNDTGNNYAVRKSANGGADNTSGSLDNFNFAPGISAFPQTTVLEIVNVQNQEKSFFGRGMYNNTAGAGNVPERQEGVGKWANTSAVINRVDVYNDGAGDYAIGSEVIVFGTD